MYRGRWYPSCAEAMDAQREYEEEISYHLEQLADRDRDESTNKEYA